jgi:hypothetical protein
MRIVTISSITTSVLDNVSLAHARDRSYGGFIHDHFSLCRNTEHNNMTATSSTRISEHSTLGAAKKVKGSQFLYVLRSYDKKNVTESVCPVVLLLPAVCTVLFSKAGSDAEKKNTKTRKYGKYECI